MATTEGKMDVCVGVCVGGCGCGCRRKGTVCVCVCVCACVCVRAFFHSPSRPSAGSCGLSLRKQSHIKLSNKKFISAILFFFLSSPVLHISNQVMNCWPS